MPDTADVVVCGAGIAGIAAAYHLTLAGVPQVLIVEAGEPLALTSDKSTECYRNFWPGPGDGMVRLMNRSLDLLDDLAQAAGDVFHISRRGYLYCTADENRLQELRRAAEESSALGAGPVRLHPGQGGAYCASGPNAPGDGFDLLCDPSLVRACYPFLSDAIVGALHVRRAGWFSAQQLGRLLLERARGRGAHLLRGQVQAVETVASRVASVRVTTPSGLMRIATPAFVDAAGPFAGSVARMLGTDLPVACELHAKVSIPDARGAIARQAPLVILSDPQSLDWSNDERAALREQGLERLLGEMPSGVHARPEGPVDSPMLLALWPYHTPPVEPEFPLKFERLYPEVVLRGLARLLPGARAFLDRMPRPFVDGGYYTRTRENRPLIGPLEIEGSFVIGALSGFGLMASMGAGELLAAHVTGAALPEYARWFLPSRYADPAYQALAHAMESTGQL
jgi:sarcosine oxidase, subunit beta